MNNSKKSIIESNFNNKRLWKCNLHSTTLTYCGKPSVNLCISYETYDTKCTGINFQTNVVTYWCFVDILDTMCIINPSRSRSSENLPPSIIFSILLIFTFSKSDKY